MKKHMDPNALRRCDLAALDAVLADDRVSAHLSNDFAHQGGKDLENNQSMRSHLISKHIAS